jgi:hypothetical protein
MNALPTGRALGLNRSEFSAFVDDGFGRYRLVDAISGMARAVAARRIEPPSRLAAEVIKATRSTSLAAAPFAGRKTSDRPVPTSGRRAALFAFEMRRVRPGLSHSVPGFASTPGLTRFSFQYSASARDSVARSSRAQPP